MPKKKDFITRISEYDGVKAVFLSDKKINAVIHDLKKGEKESILSSAKKEKQEVVFIEIDNFFKEIMEYSSHFLIKLRDAEIKYDPMGLVIPIQKNIKKGLFRGTKEVLIRKLMSIDSKFKEINKIKTEFFDNVYMSVVEGAQALVLFKRGEISVPKQIVETLKKGRILDGANIRKAQRVIKAFKDVEHGKTILPSGKDLDSLSRDAEAFLNEARVRMH